MSGPKELFEKIQETAKDQSYSHAARMLQIEKLAKQGVEACDAAETFATPKTTAAAAAAQTEAAGGSQAGNPVQAPNPAAPKPAVASVVGKGPASQPTRNA